jgi:hypothetical protein
MATIRLKLIEAHENAVENSSAGRQILDTVHSVRSRASFVLRNQLTERRK